ncbi:MAG: hypothetical protein IJG02_08860 [Thermoguttaceae bacterium]|nr:hypothetical protein [Thermoguttaceae bacterium]
MTTNHKHPSDIRQSIGPSALLALFAALLLAVLFFAAPTRSEESNGEGFVESTKLVDDIVEQLEARGDDEDDEEEEEFHCELDPNATAESLGLTPLQLPDDFYPIYSWDGPWGWGMTSEDTELIERNRKILRAMAECNMTMVHIPPDLVPMAREIGFRKVLISPYADDEEQRVKMKLPRYAAGLSPKQAEIYVREMSQSTIDDPEVIGYYILDEPSANAFEGLSNIAEAMRKITPGKLPFINLYPNYAPPEALMTDSYEDYLEYYVQRLKPMFLSYDNYMIECSEEMTVPPRAVPWWTNLLATRKVARKYGLPWWVIASSISQLPESAPTGPSRLAMQAYTALAAGANGFGWFLFFHYLDWDETPCDKRNHCRRSVQWGYMRTINEQIETLGVFLKKYRSSEVWFTRPAPVEGLPENPKTLIADLGYHFADAVKDLQPMVMVGEFTAKDDEDKHAVMFVNLDRARNLKVEPTFVGGNKVVRCVSPMDASLSGEPDRGWWVLPGHGLLLTVEPQK